MTDDSREQGIEFGDLEEDLRDVEYPTTNAELLERFGDRMLEHPGGEESLADILGSYPDDRSYEDADAVEQAVLNGIGEEAVGREAYSDRGSGRVDPGADDESF